ncbi:hypothetical protein [Laceyella sediminis]|uniref:hypothetical protein n=1 Tax=Laceyella sediminis TaxID=573074 RepID=UPI001FE4231E|nr:hypothetical protein [Laceyella sediminis]
MGKKRRKNLFSRSASPPREANEKMVLVKLAGTPELEVYDDDDPYKPDYYSKIWIPVK